MEPDRLNEEGRARWERKAAFWDELHGEEGNGFHRLLVDPAVERFTAMLDWVRRRVDVAG